MSAAGKGKARMKAAGKGDSRMKAAGKPISLILIDDNRLLREGIAAMLASQPGFKVLALSADVDEALATAREARPDVILLDFGLGDHDSVILTVKVHEDVPGARVIIMGLMPLQEDVATYVHAGASGFIMKDASSEEFFATIRAVAGGAEGLPQPLTNSLFTQIARNAVGGSKARAQARAQEAVLLTKREREVIDQIGRASCRERV